MRFLSKNTLYTILKNLPVILCVAFILIYFITGEGLTADTILHYTPENPILAALVLWGMYIAKSLSVFFPLIVLEVAGGYLFSPGIAILVNTIGLLLCSIVPYYIGVFSGAERAGRIIDKHPKLAALVKGQQNNGFTVSFILRIISILPGDLVSMYLGSTKTAFLPYISASILGSMPGVITATLLGMSITDPASPMFWISVGLYLVLTLVSVLIYRIYQKRKAEMNREEKMVS